MMLLKNGIMVSWMTCCFWQRTNGLCHALDALGTGGSILFHAGGDRRCGQWTAPLCDGGRAGYNSVGLFSYALNHYKVAVLFCVCVCVVPVLWWMCVCCSCALVDVCVLFLWWMCVCMCVCGEKKAG